MDALTPEEARLRAETVRQCREPHCGALIYFVRNQETAKLVPLAENHEAPGSTVSHFKNCTNPRRFSKAKAKEGR